MKSVAPPPKLLWTDLKSMRDPRRAVLVTTSTAERVALPFLRGVNVVQTLYVSTTKRSAVENLATKSPPANVCYAVGGGRAVDVGRFLASKWNLEAVCVPTVLSSDAFLVDSTAVREAGCVTYLPSKSADSVLLDRELLGQSQPRYHISGCGDVLSIFTGVYDWRYANVVGQARSDEPYREDVAAMAYGILDGLVRSADQIRAVSRQGIECLIAALAMEVYLCNLYGNSRPEEGSEHFFTYSLENKLARPALHGEMVSLGVLICGALQGQDTTQIKHFLQAVGLDYTNIPVSRGDIISVMSDLSGYVQEHRLRFSILNSLHADATLVGHLLDDIGFSSNSSHG